MFTIHARREFRAMGTDCVVVVYGAREYTDVLADLAQRRVALLEDLWSRFRDDSELSRLNTRAGQGPIAVSRETELLVRRMRQAWEATAGAYDPTVLAAVRANGYDRDLTDVRALETPLFLSAQPAVGMTGVEVDRGTITLPAGIGLDPGAIGKGLAADIVVDEIMAAGANGVLVDLGGDIALAGHPGSESEWCIDVRDERTRCSSGQTVRFPAGIDHAGVATSTTKTRRFADARHHVINPATGASTNEAVVQVTVAGSPAWWCEVWATAALVDPVILQDRLPAELSAFAVSADRTIMNDFSPQHESNNAEVA